MACKLFAQRPAFHLLAPRLIKVASTAFPTLCLRPNRVPNVTFRTYACTFSTSSNRGQHNGSPSTHPVLTRSQAVDYATSLLKAYEENEGGMLEKFDRVRASARDSSLSIIDRWQMLLGIRLPLQLQSIPKYGFEPTQEGLNSFNAQLSKIASEDEEIRTAIEARWDLMFSRAFGLQVNSVQHEKIPKTVEGVRALIKEIATAMLSDSFLTQVKQDIGSMSTADTVERRKALLAILIPLHQSVLARHEIRGDEGWLLFQRAVTDKMYDLEIRDSAMQATVAVFKAAGL